MTTKLVEATARPSEQKYPLTSLDGGWVLLRRLTHGEANERLDKVITFVPGKDGEEDRTLISTTRARHHDFAACVVDHNLGIDGRKADFRKSDDVDALDQAWGDEIHELITKHNDAFDADLEETVAPN